MVSTHTQPLLRNGKKGDRPYRIGEVKVNLSTSHVHLEYTTFIQGVDIIDQLCVSYMCQSRTHKWWHRVFLLDTTTVNAYILHIDTSVGAGQTLKSHLNFLLKVVQMLADSKNTSR